MHDNLYHRTSSFSLKLILGCDTLLQWVGISVFLPLLLLGDSTLNFNLEGLGGFFQVYFLCPCLVKGWRILFYQSLVDQCVSLSFIDARGGSSTSYFFRSTDKLSFQAKQQPQAAQD